MRICSKIEWQPHEQNPLQSVRNVAKYRFSNVLADGKSNRIILKPRLKLPDYLSKVPAHVSRCLIFRELCWQTAAVFAAGYV